MQDLTVGKMVAFRMGTPKDKFGNDTSIDGVYTFDNVTGGLTVVPAPDNMGAVVTADEAVGIGSFDISADVDRGEGVKTHTETVQVNKVSGEAVSFVPNFGPESDPA